MLFPHLPEPSILPSEKPHILVAGCGTGQHAINTALRYKDSQVVALDLSRQSLAYALRMAHHYDVNNISFIQADILHLDKLDQHFDIIECVGVLHHLREPEEGLKSLLKH